MKLNKIVTPLVLALSATLATTGCKHSYNGKVTKLPGHQTAAVAGTGGSGENLPASAPIDTGSQLPTGTSTPMEPGTIPTATFDLKDYNQDPAALAAYTVHFKYDSAVVQDDEQANVASAGQALTSDPTAKLLIEGHCDERGTEEYNRSLGERRALALREALAKNGIDAMRIRTISYGKDQPADTGHDEAAWAKNRRGAFILLHPKTPASGTGDLTQN